MNCSKIHRVLEIYNKLMSGRIINKAEEALNYNVNERTIQRDIDEIRKFLENAVAINGISRSIIYDRHEKGFKIERLR